MKQLGLNALKSRLMTINVERPSRAHFICRVVPAQCPFERDIKFFRWTIHIPPLCHLNPFYDELVTLRFRALGYLSDECGEDVTPYCH